MKITKVEAIPFAIPYSHPLKFASGAVHMAEHILVRVHGEDGMVGVAEAPPRPFTYGETQAGIKAVVEQIFAPQVIGLDVFEREKVLSRMNRTVGNPCAKGALDVAIWDLMGKVLGQPVTRLLGGYTDRLRVSHMIGFDDPAKMVDVAQEFLDRYGISTFKVKVGRQPFMLDVEVCRALRQHFGDKVDLYIDGNRGWTATDAARALRAMEDLDLLFAEELNPADDVMGRRWLVRQAKIPMFADESVSRPAEVVRELLNGGATAISIKTARTGFSMSQRVLFLSESIGVENYIGNQIDGQVGTIASLVFGAAYQATSSRAAELSNFLDMSDDLLADPLVISGGELKVRDLPGTGVVVDEEKLSHFRLDK
ncbi:enolase C-terminal domain-like protein [Paracoccus sp. MBLB3053]|uniref:Enolase C-terminal domain-like protein n=1 Tax=Paracoccus aurantius TaxID=3073814 RepID=A0ABU2HXD8_9RHOB|nr:enolase C-terminal domain-like protein [Paracoccus sp. MBLB3053]MDS9469683.1 enolase C-terminal domain-like protein [Paracoccus sp. MBLB3053]